MKGPPSDQVGSLLLNHEIDWQFERYFSDTHTHFQINKNNFLTSLKYFLHFLLEITKDYAGVYCHFGLEKILPV